MRGAGAFWIVVAVGAMVVAGTLDLLPPTVATHFCVLAMTALGLIGFPLACMVIWAVTWHRLFRPPPGSQP